MHLRLLRDMLPLWISIVKLYAESRQLIPDNRVLHDAKHKSAAQLAANLELCFHTNDFLERERREIKRNKLRMLRSLVKRKPPIRRPESAQSSTPQPLMTPLFLSRGNSIVGTPGTVATLDTVIIANENNLLQEVRYMIMDEIDRINELVENQHHEPGSYDILLRILLTNINFTISKADFFAKTNASKPEHRVVEHMIAYLCILSFDHLVVESTLTASRKNKYSIGSGFTLSACTPEDVFKQIEELEYLAYHLYDQALLEYLEGSQSENYKLSRHCYFAKIVDQLMTLPVKPPKITEMIADIKDIMRQIEVTYSQSDARRFTSDLARFKSSFFNKSTWDKIGDVISILCARNAARAATVLPSPSPPYTYYPNGSSGFRPLPPSPWQKKLNDGGTTDETMSDTLPTEKLKFPALVHG